MKWPARTGCESGHEIIKLVSCSTQMSMLQLLIKTKIQTNEEVS